MWVYLCTWEKKNHQVQRLYEEGQSLFFQRKTCLKICYLLPSISENDNLLAGPSYNCLDCTAQGNLFIHSYWYWYFYDIKKEHRYPWSNSSCFLQHSFAQLHNSVSLSQFRIHDNLLILRLIEDDICCVGQNHNHIDCNSYSETWWRWH